MRYSDLIEAVGHADETSTWRSPFPDDCDPEDFA
jgi:hypothetical protein